MKTGTEAPARRKRSLVELAAFAVVVAGGLIVLRVGPIWLRTLCQEWIPSWVTRRAALGVLHVLRICYAFAVLAATLAIVVPAWAIVRARKRGERLPRSARWLLLGLSMLLGLATLEAGARAWLAWTHRLIDLPTHFADAPRAVGASIRAGDLYVVVIGESSALGVPYEPWLSVADILAWQLEQLAPGRHVEVDNRAAGGICLEQAIAELWKLSRRPDAIVIYAGHNEFQARYGWSRNVRYYAEEGPKQPQNVVLAWAARVSPLCKLLDETMDKYRTGLPPPPNVKRALIDHPSFTAEEYAFLRSDFHRRLEGVVAYCEGIGALPILIMPPGNEGEFAPSRSYLPADTPQSERAAAARAFQLAKALESSDPARALASYEQLLARQPRFAEAHYRLGRLLVQAGRENEALSHFEQARDFDGLPMRCPSDFLEAYRDVARRHKVVLVDGPAVLRRVSPRGILDCHLFHDGQHPTLRGYIALAQDLLNQLLARGDFGINRPATPPRIDPAECAAHFGLDPEKWATVCERSALFYARTSELRFDPSECLARAHIYHVAGPRVASGTPPEDVGITGLGVHPAGLIDPRAAQTPGTAPAQ